MNYSNLQRIEATLTQLSQSQPSPGSFRSNLPAASDLYRPEPLLSVPTTDPDRVRPFSGPHGPLQTVDLPTFNLTSPHQPRQVSNPDLTLGILKEIEKTISAWQRELQSLALSIQDIQLDGPVVDGWLESQPLVGDTEQDRFLQHADVHQLSDYVAQLSDRPSLATTTPPRIGYQFCSLDADDQVQCQPCSAEQVPQVSLAIARHQKLRQLLSRKHYLELRLGQLAETLVDLHRQLQDSGPLMP